MIRWIAGLLFFPTIALADWHGVDEFPVLGNVVSVIGDDVLNIRAEPDHNAEIIGTLTHDARQIEVVATDDSGHWGLVNSFEASGWVPLRLVLGLNLPPAFLWIPDQARWHAFDVPLSCFGTEPFWDFELNAGATQARYRDLDMNATDYEVTWISGIAARPGGVIGLGAGDLSRGFSAVIENRMCHDGMTDRENALGLRLFIYENGEAYGLDGCCGLAP